MKLICTTVIRAAKQGDVHGGLYVIETESGEVLYYAPYEKDFINDNERGGERGLRGISVLHDRIIISDSGGFIELDKETYEIKRTFEDRDHLKSVHEIVVHDDHIFATSTAYDAIAKYDLDFNLVDFWKINGESLQDHKILTGKESITSSEKTEEDEFHINSICIANGRVAFSGLLTPLYDLETMEEVCAIPSFGPNNMKSFVHNFYQIDDSFAANLTTFSSLGLSAGSNGFTALPIPRTKNAQFVVDDIAKNNWNRGLAFDDDHILVGSSPARIIIYNRNTGQFDSEIKLESEIRHAIHGLEIIE